MESLKQLNMKHFDGGTFSETLISQEETYKLIIISIRSYFR